VRLKERKLDISILKVLFEDINKEYFELYAAAIKRNELGKVVVKIMKELKVEHFNELPQNVRNLVARHMAEIMPREEMQSRLATVTELSKKMVPAVTGLPWKSA
jgi:hypothetical protein